MHLEGLGHVLTPQGYMKIALDAGRTASQTMRMKMKGRGVLSFRSRKIELSRIEAVNDSLNSQFSRIVRAFPRLDDLSPFYVDLIKSTLDFHKLKKSLGAVQWVINKALTLKKLYENKLIHCKNMSDFNVFRNEFLGRLSSLLKQISVELNYLDCCRKEFRSFPSIKTSLPTVVLAGYPNVGKSTLLKVITGASPEVASYPFTTKKINLGYTSLSEKKIQFVDTPGLLDRPLSERNDIELKAILALKHLAKVVVFVFDSSSSCGYSLEKQILLLEDLKIHFKIPFILIDNKADLSGGDVENAIKVSGKSGLGIEALKSKIASVLLK